MKKLQFLFIGWLLITSIHSFSQTSIWGAITTDTKLGPNGDPPDWEYIVTGDISVYGTDGPDNITTLTIEPGVTLKFEPSGIPSIEIGYGSEPGRIIAQGTASNRITFTTNSSNPSHGHWEKLALNEHSTDCVIEYVDFLYGGDEWSANNNCCLGIYNPDGSNLTISNCTIDYSETKGIFVDELGFDVDFNNVTVTNSLDDGIYLENIDESVNVTFTNCSITNNDGYGIFFEDSHLAEITNCTFGGNTSNAIRCYAEQAGHISDNTVFQNETTIEVHGGAIARDSYWNDFTTSHEVNYYVYESIFVYGTDGPDGITTWEIEAGTNILIDPLDNPRISFSIGGYPSPGKMIAQGTSSNRIKFISAAESPAPGDWRSIVFRGNSLDCLLEYVDIMYGGGTSGSIAPEASLLIYAEQGSDMTISDCNIKYSQRSGIKIENEGFNIDFVNCSFSDNVDYGSWHEWCDTSKSITYTNCEFHNNGKSGLKTNPYQGFQISNCDFSNNTEFQLECFADQIKDIETNNVFHTDESIKMIAGYVTKDAVWHNFYTPYHVSYFCGTSTGVSGYDGADSITTLVIEPGTRIELGPSPKPEFNVGSGYYGPGQLIAQGSASNRITFTSSSDTPAPGHWQGIKLSQDSKNCILDFVDILYGGYITGSNQGYNLFMTNPLGPELKVTNSRILYSSTNGIVIGNTPDSLILNNNTIAGNTENGIYAYSTDDMANCTQNNIYDNGDYGIYNKDNSWIDARYCYWGSDDGPGGVGPGTGDEITDYVLYEPWLIESLPVSNPELSGTESGVSIYPNPCSNFLHIKLNHKNRFPYTIYIFNNRAQIILEKIIDCENDKIKLSGIQNGVYFVVIHDNSGKRIYSQLLIRKV